MSHRINLKTTLLSLALMSPLGASAEAFDNMYVIGDSVSDQGNLFIATETLSGFGVPNKDYYYQGRFADGEVYAGLLAQKLGVMLIPSELNGNNFSNGGARTDYSIVELDSSKPKPVNFLGQGGAFFEDTYPWTLNGQVGEFQGRDITDPDALYVVFAGSNDVVDLITMIALCNSDQELFCTGRGDPANAISTVIGGINNAIAQFVAAGATDILVPNLPNLGVVPGVTVNGQLFSALATGVSEKYNQAFSASLEMWGGVVNIIPFDIFSLLTDVVEQPGAFGFANATEACYSGFVGPVDPEGEQPTVCENPESYVYFDYEHPTTAFHAFLADRMLEAMVPDLLDYLNQQVTDLDVQEKISDGLRKKLDDVSNKLAEGKDADAVAKLEDFIEKVEAKKGEKIPEEDAVALVQRAEKIIALLDAQAEE